VDDPSRFAEMRVHAPEMTLAFTPRVERKE
jgi:hypothetical protein